MLSIPVETPIAQEDEEEIGKNGTQMMPTGDGWTFSIGRRESGGRVEDDPGFYGAFKIEVDDVPNTGPPSPKEAAKSAPEQPAPVQNRIDSLMHAFRCPLTVP